MENFRIGIIGNIGAGKSTLVKAAKEKPFCDILMEHFPSLRGNANVHSFKEEFICSEEMLIIIAMLEVNNLIFNSNIAPPYVIKSKKRVGAKEGDHITLLNLFMKYNHTKKNDKKKFI